MSWNVFTGFSSSGVIPSLLKRKQAVHADTGDLPGISPHDLTQLIAASYQGTNEGAATGAAAGYTFDPEFSNRRQKVFTDAYGNPIVDFTGSRVAGDWLFADLPMALGLEQHTKRFKDSQKIVNDVRNKYGDRPVTAIGHSLGGSLAEHSGADRVIAVDKGVGLNGIGKQLGEHNTSIRASSDLVSGLQVTQRGGNKINLSQTHFMDPLNAHDFQHVQRRLPADSHF